jgi:hypothetical protein
MMVAENSPAYAQHHSAVPPDDQLERRSIATVGKARQQPLVGQRSGRIRVRLPANDAEQPA